MKFQKILRTFLWMLPYFLSGFMAPVIFDIAPSKRVAGHWAGSLFLFSIVWALFLTYRHGYKTWTKGFVLGYLLLAVIFWSWRFQNSDPLTSSFLLGYRADIWHGTLTGLYLVLAVLLVFFGYRRGTGISDTGSQPHKHPTNSISL